MTAATLTLRRYAPMWPMVLVLLASWAAYQVISFTLAAITTDGVPIDVAAYRLAAENIVNGGPLYGHPDPDGAVYRYAPWLAWLWIPLLPLPVEPVAWAWAGLLVIATVAACIPAARVGPLGVAVALLLGPGLFIGALAGNVTPLVVCGLAYLLPTRWGPAMVGVAASIKVFPILLVLPWYREPRRVAVAVVVAASLWAPALLYDIGSYTTNPGSGLASLWAVSPLLWAAVAAANLAVAGWLAWRRSPWAWVAAALLVYTLPPRSIIAAEAFVLAAVPRMLAWRNESSPR